MINTMHCYRTFIILWMFSLLAACEMPPKYDQSGLKMQVVHAAGADYQGINGYYAPYPFAYGKVIWNNTEIDAFVLSRAVSEETTLGVVPIEKWTIKDARQSQDILIVVPSDSSLLLRNGEDPNYSNFALMRLLDHWILHRDGLNGREITSKVAITD